MGCIHYSNKCNAKFGEPIFVSRTLYKVAKEEDSIALEADALHLKTDIYTSLGVSTGLRK